MTPRPGLDLPGGGDGPVFAAPWQAQVFAMTVRLCEQGHVSWSEWSGYLGREIAAAGPTRPADGSDYYDRWLAALEAVVVDKDLAGAAELAERRDAWDRAARATPHGQPIVLGRDRPPG